MAKAEKRKVEYEKKLKAYNKGQVVALIWLLAVNFLSCLYLIVAFMFYYFRLKDPRKKRSLRSRCRR